MLVTVVGMKPTNFTSNDGTQINGTTLFVTYLDERVTGLKADKVFIKQSVELPKGLSVGQKISLLYNQYGKVDEVRGA